MTTTTDADRAKALAIVDECVFYSEDDKANILIGTDGASCSTDRIEARIAQALADERAVATGPRITLVTHMDLPDGVPWAKNGWYIKLASGQWRHICGLTELPGCEAAANALAAKEPQQ